MSLPPNRELLKEHPNKFYCETGIYRGDSLQQALDAGFETIIGFELFEEHINFCKNRFPDEPRIKYVHGDSALVLWDTIKEIDEPITFLLDAHSQLLEDEPPMINPFPLLKELEQIGRHHIKNHTIIIDDWLYMTHYAVTGWTDYDIKNAVWNIAKNDGYRMEYIANPVRNNMLIIAPK